ncbi:archaeal proteasome endopeptidase complex subunit alpha [archaeon]|jgi:proteasome alpha subunit|nr:archaeal proteasome endopeptidase complex subunit alpha [archaeon]MBT6182845.1 archaeal proteasome endopeptidase complex subunit alpha [archaeon]MBT6606805.1 archaeal proteasome endopeptidase complex subunit alpha [archaeon]MBT7251722.1 archaeal proteasome endopeptidase complex subunit alpha [archaeon]MBT7660505.1 archaeal proteasome endopeptidase complex subunit alpha [archaeon]
MDDIQHQQMGYDRAATMFAPDGHILQVEYAEKTIRLGSSSIGIVFDKGVLILSDRRQRDILVVESSANKIHEIDDHIICVSAGISSDARVLIEKARVIAQQHRVTYDSAPTTEAVVREISDIKQQFTQYGGARPFGVSMMFAGINGDEVLYTTDITGNYLKYNANAIGENDEAIKTLLREKYTKGLSKKKAVELALEIFKEVQRDNFSVENFDAGILEEGKITKVSGRKLEDFD